MARSRLRADAYASVSRILDAARKLFGTSDGTATLNQIAEEAGVGIATLYRHFASKEALAREVYSNIFNAELEPMIVAFSRSNVSREEMLELFSSLLDIIDREQWIVRALDKPSDVIRDLLAEHDVLLRQTISKAQQNGYLRPDLSSDDLPILLALIATGFPSLGTDSSTRRRFLGLLLDGLNPRNAQPLAPPAPMSNEGKEQ